MAYFKLIETSQTWTCPKDGDYKIVCIAGGEAAGRVAGGMTSFGSYLSAVGSLPFCGAKGKGGYNGMNGYVLSNPSMYGSIASSIAVDSNYFPVGGAGYGAGGHHTGTSSSAEGGRAGKMNMTIVSLTKNQSVDCTVGKGGAGSGNNVSGTDGVIMIQEV